MFINDLVSINPNTHQPDVTKEVTIPEGKWVVKVQRLTETLLPEDGEDDLEYADTRLSANRFWYKLIGIEEGIVERYRTKYRWNSDNESEIDHEQFVLVADQPFGVITNNARGQGFRYTRQIIQARPKGRPPLPLRNLHFRKGPQGWGWRWVRLIELASLLNQPPHKVWNGFCDFNDRTNGLKFLCGQDLVREAREHEGYLMPLLHLLKHYQMSEADIANIWVPAGWAMSVLYLLYWGYRPRGW